MSPTEDALRAELEDARRELHRLRDAWAKRRAVGTSWHLALSGHAPGEPPGSPPTPESILGRLSLIRLDLLRAGKVDAPPSREERQLARLAEVYQGAIDATWYEGRANQGPLEAAEARVSRLQLELNQRYPAPPIDTTPPMGVRL